MSVRVGQNRGRVFNNIHVDVCLTFCRNCSLKPALRGFFFTLSGTVGAAAAAAAVASGSISESDVGCLLAPTIDVDTVADDDDGSFVVLVDNWSPDLLRATALIAGLADPLLLDPLSAS